MTPHTNGTTAIGQPYEALTITELASHEFPPMTWTIDDLLPSGALGLLVGRPKLGKSLFAIDMMASVARGEPFIGKATNQGPALYIPAEDALVLVRERLLNRLKTDRNIPLHVVPADGSLDQSIRFDDPDSLTRLAATLEKYQPRLVVLDPFREFHSKREDKADDMAALLRPLRQMAHEFDATLLIVHHRNKHATDPSTATRGSSAIVGGVDLVLTMEMSDESDDAELDGKQVLKLRIEGRYGPRQRLGARLRTGLRWESADPRLADDLPVRERVQRHLEATGETLTAEELADVIKTPKRSVQNVLPTLLSAGVATRHGAGTKVDPYRYGPFQQPLGTNVGRIQDESFVSQTGKTADSSQIPHVQETTGTNPSHRDDPAHVVRALYDSGLFDDLDEQGPTDIAGESVYPVLTYAKRALDAGDTEKLTKLLKAVEPMIGARS